MYSGALPSTDRRTLGAYGIETITAAQQSAIRATVSDFPEKLKQAKIDFAKFKAGLDLGLFKQSQNTKRVTTWFAEFPRLWEAIRPNYLPQPGQTMSAHREAVRKEADAFVAVLGTDPQVRNQLGIAPLIVAGVLVAAIAGIAGILWAVGYVKEQGNISRMIDEVVAGKLPPDVLKKAVAEANSGGFLGDITGLLKWGAIGLGIFYLAPVVVGAFKGKK